MKQSHYLLGDLINACLRGTSSATVSYKAMESARSDFNINTQDALLNFIGSGGMESPDFIISKKWENNPDKETIIMIDSYNFYTGFLYGYMAFFFQPKTDKWRIKSFKKNNNPDPRNLSLKAALEKIGYGTQGGEKNE